MRIRITTTFIDLDATDPEKETVEAGTEITVKADRGGELIRLGLAVDLGATEPKAPPAPVTPPATGGTD